MYIIIILSCIYNVRTSVSGGCTSIIHIEWVLPIHVHTCKCRSSYMYMFIHVNVGTLHIALPSQLFSWCSMTVQQIMWLLPSEGHWEESSRLDCPLVCAVLLLSYYYHSTCTYTHIEHTTYGGANKCYIYTVWTCTCMYVHHVCTCIIRTYNVHCI